MGWKELSGIATSPRLPLLTGVIGVAGAVAAVLTGTWPATAAVAGLVGGAGLAVAAMRRATAAQQAELARLGELVERRAEQVTALSHELRTPLSMIKGAADLLGEGSPGPLTPDQQRFITIVDQQCAQVIALCESLLTQAKIEAGLFTPRLEQVDVSVVARDVVIAMRALCAERKQRITLDTPQVTPHIQADPMLIVQALTNLLSNASRFTTVGGGIDVRVAVIDTGIAVYVTDDGAGMTREQRRRLFQRFVTGRPLADGTGLGLVITKTIIELHGGSIMVDTTSMHGTTFLFTLPG
ncbi:HAMP domain-containing sensor histidine kinase [Nonomuraea jabiensis]|uniref:histidine kinase n=1 Tax=Nonomuraea jabiensis TaxID=882448 RepID=A0A7W9G8K7_9ACTN|nr:HAMP domain-containing sensor histidine kinase [Nonomuraea jabiensis]MBB5779154.1 signal transduction histidine kinase [Nonomuraea jabiensis]